MNLIEFIEDYHMSPLTELDFAHAAEDVEDCPELVNAAKYFLEGRAAFFSALKEIGVEMG